MAAKKIYRESANISGKLKQNENRSAGDTDLCSKGPDKVHKGFVKELVIGLYTIKLRSGRYKELLHFNKDVSRVFSNVKYVKYFNADRNVNNAKTDHIIVGSANHCGRS